MTLTNENYYSREAAIEYMSASQYKSFVRCEAAALAEIRGEYTSPTSSAMLVGGYVDAWFSGELPLFQAQHPEIFKRDGTLKAEYISAQNIIARLESDELFSMLLSGKKQEIVTGKIAGVPFRGKLDVLLDGETCHRITERFPETENVFGDDPAGAIVDMKIMRDMESVWDQETRTRVPFFEAYGYHYQGAIYKELVGGDLPFVLAVGTKETEPDLEAISLEGDGYLRHTLYEIEDSVPRYQAIKRGEVEPHRCGKCAYCRATKNLTRIKDRTEFSLE